MIIIAKQGLVKRLYIAGPMTGYELFNAPAFADAAAEWTAKGFVTVNPAELASEPPYDKPWAFYMRKALTLMLTCDEILMLRHWSNSTGAKIEWNLAQKLFIPMHYQENL